MGPSSRRSFKWRDVSVSSAREIGGLALLVKGNKANWDMATFGGAGIWRVKVRTAGHFCKGR